MEGLKRKIKGMLEQEPFKNRELKLMGIGADKVVFETAGSTRKIIKVSRDILRWKVANLLGDESGSAISPDEGNHDLQKSMIGEEKGSEEDAKEIFGPEHFLRRGVFRIKIPITKDFLMSFVKDSQKILVEKLPDDFEDEIEMLAETQLVAEEFKNPEKFLPISFNTDLIIDKDFYATKNIEEGLSKARALIDANFLPEFEELLSDEGYAGTIKEIVSKIIEYTKKTGMLVDIFGPNNITLYRKEDDSVDYHVLDIIMPGLKENWARNISQDPQLRLLRHYYVYFYSIQSLADKVGIEDNLEPEDLVYFNGHGLPTGDWPSAVLQ